LADQNGVHLESVWGHNVIEFNENFDKAIDEIVQYAKQSKETAIGVKRIMVLESERFDADMLQAYLQRTGIDFSWIPNSGQDDDSFDPVSITILKGLIKAAMAPDFNRGFLEPQLTHLDDVKPATNTFKPVTATEPQTNHFPSPYAPYATPTTKNTVVKSSANMENNWNWKIIASSILLAVGLIGLLGYIGMRISDNVAQKANSTAQSPTVTVTPSPTTTSAPSPTPTTETPAATTPTPTTLPDFKKNEVWVLVLNGNNVAGEAKTIAGILQGNGFTTRAPGNNPTRNIQTTTVSYKDPRSQKLAEEVVKLIESRYPSAKAVLDPNTKDDIFVLLGVK
jgi:hypothetical protein